jgi:hypothetical protein
VATEEFYLLKCCEVLEAKSKMAEQWLDGRLACYLLMLLISKAAHGTCAEYEATAY